jgi:hypothetical protein
VALAIGLMPLIVGGTWSVIEDASAGEAGR